MHFAFAFSLYIIPHTNEKSAGATLRAKCWQTFVSIITQWQFYSKVFQGLLWNWVSQRFSIYYIFRCIGCVEIQFWLWRFVSTNYIVQSLNSPFFPSPYRGWTRAGERRVQDNLYAHAQNAAIFPPGGKNHIWKYFPDLACGVIFWMIICRQQFLHLDWLKTCQLISNQWNFPSATLNHIRFVFFLSQYQRERKKSLPRFVANWKHRLRLESARAALCK